MTMDHFLKMLFKSCIMILGWIGGTISMLLTMLSLTLFQGFGVDACQVISNTSDSDVASCKASSGNWWNTESYQDLNKDQIGKLRDIRSKYVVYDYCTDTSRFPDPPVECAINWYEG